MTPWFSFSSPSVRELMLFLSPSMKIWERWGRGDVSKRERKWKEEMLSGVRKEKQNISLSLSCCGSHNKQGEKGIFFDPGDSFYGKSGVYLANEISFWSRSDKWKHAPEKERQKRGLHLWEFIFSLRSKKKTGRSRWVFPRQKLILPETSAIPNHHRVCSSVPTKEIFFRGNPAPFPFAPPFWLFAPCNFFPPSLFFADLVQQKPWFFSLTINGTLLCSKDVL